MEYTVRFMTIEEHDSLSSFTSSKLDKIVINISSRFDESWSSKFGCNSNIRSKESYAGIIASSPNLILDYIDTNTQHIEFVINSDYCLDVVVSIYLAVYIAEYKKIPPLYNELLDCVKYDREKEYLFNHYNNVNIMSVLKSIPFIISRDHSYSSEVKIKAINRAIEFIDFILKRLADANQILTTDLFDTSLINYGMGFDAEINFVNDDVIQYKDQLLDVNQVKEIRCLLYSEILQKRVIANGAIFMKQSKSKLSDLWINVKHFHKNDSQFDFIVQKCDNYVGLKSKERIEIESNNNFILSRYEIRTRKRTGLKLYNLGMYLEKAEIIKEKELLNDEDIIKWRAYGTVSNRFNDSYWSTNNFSWYDGRNHHGEFVDSPTLNSLLSIDDVINIFKSHSQHSFKEIDLRVHLTFVYGIKDKYYEKMCSTMKTDYELGSILETPSNESNYYINEFFDYENNKEKISSYIAKQYILDEMKALLNDDTISAKFIESLKCSVLIFEQGIGILTLHLNKLYDDTLDLSISDVKKVIVNCSNLGEQVTKIAIQNTRFADKVRIDKPVFYLNGFIESNILEEDVVRQDMAVLLGYNNINNDNKTVTTFNEYDDFLETKSISKIGVSHVTYSSNPLEAIKEIKKEEDYYYIFLFSLFHRVTLINFSLLLSELDRLKKVKLIKSLRKMYLSFVTQNYFSQISVDPELLKYYKRINECYEIPNLIHEVSEQVGTIDDFYQNEFKYKMEFISMIGIPIIFISTLASIGFFSTDGVIFDLSQITFLIFCFYFLWTMYVTRKK